MARMAAAGRAEGAPGSSSTTSSLKHGYPAFHSAGMATGSPVKPSVLEQ